MMGYWLLVIMTARTVMAMQMQSCSPASPAVFYRRHIDRTRTGYDHTATTAATAEECGRECTRDSKCLGFEYTPVTLGCQMKKCGNAMYLAHTPGTDFYQSYAPACYPNPCLHMGACTPDDSCSYTCACLPEFGGANCETQIWSHNLVKNPNTRDTLSHWDVYQNGGAGCKARTQDLAADCGGARGAEQVDGYMATSYGWCRRRQTVSLTNHGISTTHLDTQPDIKVSEWVNDGWDGEHQFKVQLRNGGGGVMATYDTGVWRPETIFNGWQKLEHIFPAGSYGVGVRSVKIEDGGKDTLFWGGHYGSLMGAVNVMVKL